MRVFLSALTFDLAGALHLDVTPDSGAGPIARRVNRAATLDGGVAFNDGGYSEGDRTINLTWRPRSKAREQQVASLVQNHGLLNASLPEGYFGVVPERYQPGTDRSTLTLLVKEKIA